MSTSGKFYKMSAPQPQFTIRPQFIVEHVEDSEFVDACNCEVVSCRVKGQSNQRLISVEFFLDFEVEHP